MFPLEVMHRYFNNADHWGVVVVGMEAPGNVWCEPNQAWEPMFLDQPLAHELLLSTCCQQEPLQWRLFNEFVCLLLRMAL